MVVAVVSWTLLASCEWDSLVTRQCGAYEPRAFDVSEPGAPETELAGWIRAKMRGQGTPATAPGWWEANDRLLYATSPTSDPIAVGLD